MVPISYSRCYWSILLDFFYLGLQGRSAANMEVSSKTLQGSTPALLQVEYPTVGKSFHLPMLHLPSAKMRTVNTSFTSLQLPSKCLGRDLMAENAKSCFYGKNKAERDY